MKTPLSHLHRNRFGTFYFRITIDGKTVKRSLKTKLPEFATMRVAALNWQWSTMKQPNEPNVADIVKALKAKTAPKFDATFPDGSTFKGIKTDDDARRAKELMLARIEAIGPIEQQYRPQQLQQAPQTAAAHFKPGKRFSKVTPVYIEEKKVDDQNRTKTIDDKESTYRFFIEHFGDLSIGQIDKTKATDFKKALIATKISTVRINTKIGHMSDFFAWAIGNGEADANPFAGTRISKKSKIAETTEHYEPFTSEDLDCIFTAGNYETYTIANKPHFHWLPFLLLYTGARPEELASVKLAQIRNEHGIDFIALKSGKNSNSIRKIPFHRAVLASKFLNYVKTRRKEDPSGLLFPQLKPSKNGYAKNVSRRFNENYLASLDFNEPTKRLYSFRATFITRMSELNVNTAMLMALVGHFEQDKLDLSSPHFKNYQGVKKIAALKDCIEHFDVVLPMQF